MTGTPQKRNQALATWIGKSGRSYRQVALIATAITMTSQAIPLRPAERARSRTFDHIGLDPAAHQVRDRIRPFL